MSPWWTRLKRCWISGGMMLLAMAAPCTTDATLHSTCLNQVQKNLFAMVGFPASLLVRNRCPAFMRRMKREGGENPPRTRRCNGHPHAFGHWKTCRLVPQDPDSPGRPNANRPKPEDLPVA
jgi:hypothetical protein